MAKVDRDLQPVLARRGDQPLEILEAAERGMQRVVAALGLPIAYGLPTSVGPGVSVLLRPLRALVPIGWIGGK
jgi:hypothetical protein